jgi:hypothetical protein
MRSGDRPGLQNRRTAGLPVVGGFDPHSLPPFIFNWLGPPPIHSQSETWGQNRRDISCSNDVQNISPVVSKLKCPVFLAHDLSGFS